MPICLRTNTEEPMLLGHPYQPKRRPRQIIQESPKGKRNTRYLGRSALAPVACENSTATAAAHPKDDRRRGRLPTLTPWPECSPLNCRQYFPPRSQTLSYRLFIGPCINPYHFLDCVRSMREVCRIHLNRVLSRRLAFSLKKCRSKYDEPGSCQIDHVCWCVAASWHIISTRLIRLEVV